MLADLAPSLQVRGDFVTLKLDEFRTLSALIAKTIPVDEKWYLSQYPDIAEAVKRGDQPSAKIHFQEHGFREGRLPSLPKVDEVWYLKTYPDIAKAVASGSPKNALAHYITDGVREGRRPVPPAQQSTQQSRRR